MLILFETLQLILVYVGLAYLCYRPFYNKARGLWGRIVLFFCLLITVEVLGYVIIFSLISEKVAYLWFIFTLPIVWRFYMGTIEESKYKLMLILMLASCYGAFVCGTAALISNLCILTNVTNAKIYTLITLMLGVATYRHVYKFISKKLVPLINLVKPEELQQTYLMPLFYFILQGIFFTLYDTLGQMNNLVYFVILLALNFSIYFLITDIINTLNGIIDKIRLMEEISFGDKLLELQKSQYASWVTQIEEVRRARHDIKHYMSMVQRFLDDDDKAGLQEHVKNFQRTLPETSPMLLCRNMAVNAILLHYYERARKEKIRLEMHVNVDDEIAIDSQDLAVIFGNCLENAFEACGRMKETAEKSVSLMAKPMGKGLAMVIDNTFDGKVVKEKDVYLSSKRENQPGIGMTSIKLVAEKYNGIVSFETEDNLFMTSIRLGGRITKNGGGKCGE